MLSSQEAANRLGIKVSTLYVYVSRGLIRSHPDPGSRRSLFDADEVERMAERSRSGRRLDSRLAVVTTSVTSLDERGPSYRGRPAIEMAGSSSLEEVAEVLWQRELTEAAWNAPELGAVPVSLSLRDRLPWATIMAAAADPFRSDRRPEAIAAAAAGIIAAQVAAQGPTGSGPIARRLASVVVRSEEDRDRAAPLIDAAMVLLADHELATSTLAVRVAASARSDVYDAVLAGGGAIAGMAHSGASDLTLDLLQQAAAVGAASALGEALRRHDRIPGFGHGAYPDGDPRARCLLALVRPAMTKPQRSTLDEVLEVTASRGLPGPNIDLALGALAMTFDMQPGSTPVLFSIARVAGWAAHFTEELTEPPLRFRARAIYSHDS